jgi:hypothetical protein
VALFALVLLAVVTAIFFTGPGQWRQRLFGGGPSVHTLAVLPLQNLSGDPSQEYFADGMTEALTTELARSESLQVISRSSSMGYKNSNKPLPLIARELHADAIVEGSTCVSPHNLSAQPLINTCGPRTSNAISTTFWRCKTM